MFPRLVAWLLALSLGCAHASPQPTRTVTEVAWQPWTSEAFARAQAERKLILVSVQAGFCHWCHVMNRVTYGDPEVLALLNENFVALRVDADARPDLAERYQRYAWPATAILSPDAEPVTALRGHQPPRRFARLLQGYVSDLRAGRPLGERPVESELDPELADLAVLQAFVENQLDRTYDRQAGGWGRPQKYPWWAPVEHAFLRSRQPSERVWEHRALTSLEGYRQIADPVWGGIYQYSVRGTWNDPHFEKIAPVQAGALHNFAEAYQITGDPRWLEEAQSLRRYIDRFLGDPRGGFYTSQDADVGSHGSGPSMSGEEFYALDDRGRARIGAMPRTDANVYANWNGMFLRSYAKLYAASGDPTVLEAAARTADRVLEELQTADGGMAHGGTEAERSRFHLADQVEMGRGLVALYEVSADPRYLEAAVAIANFIARELVDEERGGFLAHTADPDATGVFARRRHPLIDNAVAARFLLRLGRLRGDDAQVELAHRTVRSLGDRETIRRHGRKVGELALALRELRTGYLMLSIVGPDDEATLALHRGALQWYFPGRLVEVRRPGTGRYPYPGRPAVYLCSQNACSMPVSDPQQIRPAAEAFLAREQNE
ncbi:MAG: DUF255 domain-containing protein [Myxococcota bacterium]